jgi:predicted secreted Zn-dependent protease
MAECDGFITINLLLNTSLMMLCSIKKYMKIAFSKFMLLWSVQADFQAVFCRLVLMAESLVLIKPSNLSETAPTLFTDWNELESAIHC